MIYMIYFVYQDTVCACIRFFFLLWLFKNKVDCEANHFSVVISSQLTGAHSRKFSSCKAKLSTVKHPSAPKAFFQLQ